jgi:hypothetical protein
MIGERAYQYALERRHKLREELDEIERFIVVCERYAEAEEPRHLVSVTAAVATETHNESAFTERLEERQKRRRSAIRDDDLHTRLRAILLERGAPMSRQELIDALAARGVNPESQDPTNWLGTRMYRRRESYVQIRGRGYWLADVPNASIGHVPSVSSTVPAAPVGEIERDELFS